MHGGLRIGGEVNDRFDADLQFHGYLFRVGSGSEVALEVTQLGSAAGLDSTLLVYQPGQSGFGPSAIAVDDDSGFAAKSKISSLVLGEQNTYLVVVGTAMGIGRGHYRLTLTCLSEDCEPAPDLEEECPNEIEEFIRSCVSDQLADAKEMSQETAFDLCVDSPFAGFGDEPGEVFADMCEFEVPAPDFCARGVEDFVDILVPACIELLAPELRTDSPPACFELDAICLETSCASEGLNIVDGACFDDGDNCCI